MVDINEAIGFIIRNDHNENMEDMQDSDLTNLKLQKLLYYTQGHVLAEFNTPLFSNEFSAWHHGPVIESIYHKFKEFGSDLIGFEIGGQDEYNCPTIIEDKKLFSFLNKTMDYYNQYSPWKLRNMSHEESPWQSAGGVGVLISQQSILEFFNQDVVKARIL